MRGKKVWYVLVLLALVGMLQGCDIQITSYPYTMNMSNKVYCLTSDANCSSLQNPACITLADGVQNTTLDCQGFTLYGPEIDSNNYGVTMGLYGMISNGIKNDVIKNCKITNFGFGIFTYSGPMNSSLINNTASNNSYGLFIENTSLMNIESNTLINNSAMGIYVIYNSNTALVNNIVTDNGIGIFSGGGYTAGSNGITLVNNSAYDNGVYGFEFSYTLSGSMTGYAASGNAFNFRFYDSPIAVTPPIPSVLTQSVTPASGTATGSVAPTFICGYYDVMNGTKNNPLVAFTDNTITVTIDSTTYNASPYGNSSLTINDSHYSGVNLTAGTHTWYCSASATGYQSQMGPTQTYVVEVSGGSPLMTKTPTSGQAEPVSYTWSFALIIIVILGLAIGYFIIKNALFTGH
jgi:parallel beta-helix repeat protein